MAERHPGLDAGQEFLAVADEADALAQRQDVLANPGQAPLQPLAWRVGGPEVQFLARHVKRGVGKVRHIIIAHRAPAMIRMRMGQHNHVDRGGVDAGLPQAVQHHAAVWAAQLLRTKPIFVEQRALPPASSSRQFCSIRTRSVGRPASVSAASIDWLPGPLKIVATEGATAGRPAL
jgi:hypothetical protein